MVPLSDPQLLQWTVVVLGGSLAADAAIDIDIPTIHPFDTDDGINASFYARYGCAHVGPGNTHGHSSKKCQSDVNGAPALLKLFVFLSVSHCWRWRKDDGVSEDKSGGRRRGWGGAWSPKGHLKSLRLSSTTDSSTTGSSTLDSSTPRLLHSRLLHPRLLHAPPPQTHPLPGSSTPGSSTPDSSTPDSSITRLLHPQAPPSQAPPPQFCLRRYQHLRMESNCQEDFA
ncbi:hypothetical protein EYF80_048157 [Liparis tanakae]|uniref:Uncharacterized protein n=1 Tax=Liparis tanakae TaxID=230148 RepID=A0A4Z2FL99_9TELE|nr:hypothetical protein EYF80_048157 [Liparis tanakae]